MSRSPSNSHEDFQNLITQKISSFKNLSLEESTCSNENDQNNINYQNLITQKLDKGSLFFEDEFECRENFQFLKTQKLACNEQLSDVSSEGEEGPILPIEGNNEDRKKASKAIEKEVNLKAI